MRLLILTATLLLAATNYAQELKVKMEGVKIDFVADMQNTSGSVSGFVAKILFNTDDLASSVITGTVSVKTLETGNTKRDEHLKSADYFDAETYPTMSFTSGEIKLMGDHFEMIGKMKIKNIEREEKISFTFVDNIFSAECTIQAANYDLGSFAKKKPENTNVKISMSIPVE
ncbi:MAG: YceI family protein [Crocinitomicaceae bacterium]|nr:YceI family protein [Crocinitomicaceae bacterium]